MTTHFGFLIVKAALIGGVIVAVTELVKKNSLTAAIVHSLPLVSVTALMWMFMETKDTSLIARHATGTFWFVLPTLPFFLILPALLRRGWVFWPALALGLLITFVLYLITMRLLKSAGITI